MTSPEHPQDPALDPDSPGWGPEDQGSRPGVPLGRADQQPPDEVEQETEG